MPDPQGKLKFRNYVWLMINASVLVAIFLGLLYLVGCVANVR